VILIVMPLILRILIGLALLPFAAFCAFGFLATFEPPGHVSLRIAYGIIGLACLVGMAWIAWPRKQRDGQ
jgi:hypothetical protein